MANATTFLYKAGKKRKTIHLLLFTALILMHSSCFQHYYKTNSTPVTDAAFLEKLRASNKYFIIHYEDKVMGTQQLKIANDIVEADLVPLPKEHSYHKSPKMNDENVVKKKHEVTTLMEVHFYTNTSFSTDQSHIAVPISTINRLDIYEFDPTATRQHRVLSYVGVAVGTWMLAICIYAIINPPVSF